MDEECLICAERIDGELRLEAVGACNHHGVCTVCFLRMRSLLQDCSCPICKTDLEFVIAPGVKLAKQGRDSFEHFTIWGEDAGPDHVYDHKSRMFFPKEYHKKQIQKLRVCKCQECGAWKRDMGGLRNHAKEHNKFLCALCIEHKKVFPSEHVMYDNAEYEKHLRSGDGDGSEGHPKCQFCNKRYYDKNLLISHLEKDHYSCHICVKNGTQFKYYKNYESLENHFRQMHYLCEEKSCLEKKFVVFGNNIDYVSHLHSWHPTLQISKSIPLNFKSYGENEDQEENFVDNFGMGSESYIGSSSTRYDGGVGGREMNGEWQVMMPQGARDPREAQRLAAAREGNSNSTQHQVEHTFVSTDYPTLQGEIKASNSSEGSMTAKWSKKHENSSKEDYPALIGAERKAPLGQSRMSNWSSRIKVDKKLSVRKPSTMSARRDMLNASMTSSTEVGEETFSGPFAYSLQHQINQQLQTGANTGKKKAPTQASISVKDTIAPPASDLKCDSGSSELTLAEKIKIEQMTMEDNKKAKQKKNNSKDKNSQTPASSTSASSKKAPPPPLPPGLGLFAPPPSAVSSSTATSNTVKESKPTGNANTKASLDVPLNKNISMPSKKKASTQANKIPGGWGAALKADGLSTKKKNTKKQASGLTVVKKSSSVKENEKEPTVSTNSKIPPSTSWFWIIEFWIIFV